MFLNITIIDRDEIYKTKLHIHRMFYLDLRESNPKTLNFYIKMKNSNLMTVGAF